jgi:hypothetical protein
VGDENEEMNLGKIHCKQDVNVTMYPPCTTVVLYVNKKEIVLLI